MTEAIEKTVAPVDDFSLAEAVRRRYRALILHWPDNFSSTNALPLAVYRTAAMLGVLALQRLRGAQVVRVVHDVNDLTGRRRWLIGLNRAVCQRLTSRYLFLSDSSREEFARRYPSEAAKPGVTLFHPRFVDDLQGCAAERSRSPALRFVGDIKPYKGLDRFLRLAATSKTPITLEIIGRCEDDAYARTVAEAVRAAEATGSRISWDARRPDHDELAEAMRTARAVVLPYVQGWNSGMAINALEQGAPLVCSDLPIFRELAAATGSEWITVYRSDGSDFAACIERAAGTTLNREARERLRAFLADLDWERFVRGLEPLLDAPAGAEGNERAVAPSS